MARLHSESIPGSTLASTARVVDGFVTTQTDHSGISSSFTRAYTATGITRTATDGRSNTTTTHTDLAGRSISSTDAAGNTTTTVYDEDFDAPSVITNAQGKTASYKYDLRGRKVAEWGTAIQSPRRLVGGLDKCAAFAPKGRGRNGVRPSQSDRGLGESLDKRAAFARRGEGAMGCARVNIGNRKTAQEAAEEATAYDANNLNQYTAIQTGEEAAFVPTFDADGNQTKVKTSTGIWNVVYNAENRPVTFTSEDGATIVECTYDYMGRRHTRKITVNGSVTNYLRYIYRGYLQIAAINAVSGVFQWFILWDPTQPVATRPLGIRKDGTWYTYGWDLTKNICEVFGSDGYIKTAYTYTPYGSVTANGNVTQPIQWSSEYNDTELGLVYYNYRHYNPADGRWSSRDKMQETENKNLYLLANNLPSLYTDKIGLAVTLEDCNRLKAKVETGSHRLSRQITKLVKELKRTCGLPPIFCFACPPQGRGTLGSFSPNKDSKGNYLRTGRLIFYVSGMTSIEHFIGVIQHELIHAVQNCRTNRNKEIKKLGACRASVYREIVAYLEGGNCRHEANVRECVIRRAANSAYFNHCNNDWRRAYEIAKEEYEKVPKKYNPFR